MPAPATNVALANKALAKFGGGSIATMTDAVPPGPAVARVYETLVDELFSYPWTFSKETVALTRVVDEAPGSDGMLMAGWRFAYAMPANRLAPPEKYLGDPRFEFSPITRFAVQNDLVYSDAEALWAIVRLRPDEAVWPGYFRSAFVACLAAELVIPISGNSGLFEKLEQIAFGTPSEGRRGGLLGAAMKADARNSGGQQLAIDDLMSSWRA